MPEDNLNITDSRTSITYSLPLHEGAVRSTDLRQIKTGPDDFGLMSYDPAFMNTASCRSAITFIDGDKGILRYRGYPIEELAANATFSEVAYLIIYGELPNKQQMNKWRNDLGDHSLLHERMVKLIDHFPLNAHPMGMLASLIASMASFYPENSEQDLDTHVVRLVAQRHGVVGGRQGRI